MQSLLTDKVILPLSVYASYSTKLLPIGFKGRALRKGVYIYIHSENKETLWQTL